MSDADPFRRRVGTMLRGKWVLDRLLGVGGMAAVYAATHKIGRREAIKILHPEVAGSREMVERFEQEAHAVNRLKHPGAVEVRDHDVTEDGAPFLVMELLEGESLGARLSRELVPLGDALRYADELLDVLAAAHAQGIIHRDVKPDNLFVTREGRLKVLDFGIARMLEGSPRSARTAFGLTMGTPHYMPPEQIVGGTIDHRADLYAVGATLFRLAAGRHAHEGHADMELLVKVSTEPAPPLCSIAPHAPAPLGLVVDRALALRPDDRYPDARTMQGDVQALRRGEAPPFATAHPPVRSVAAPRSAPSTAVGGAMAAGGRTPTGVAPAGYTPTGVSPAGHPPTGVAPAGHPPTGVASAGHPPTGVAPAGYVPTGAAPAQAPLPTGVAAGYARNEASTAAPPPGYGPTGGVTAQAPVGYAPAGGATVQAPAAYAAAGSAAAQATVRHAPAGVAAAQATASRLPAGPAAASLASAAASPTVAAAPAPLRAASAFASAPSDAGPTRDQAGRRGGLDRRARYLVAFGALALCLLLLFGGIWLFGGDASSASQDPPLPGPDPTGGEAPPPGATPVGGTPGGGTPVGGTPGGGTPGGGASPPPPRVAPLPGAQPPGPGKGHEKDNDKRREHEKDRHKDGGKKGGR